MAGKYPLLFHFYIESALTLVLVPLWAGSLENAWIPRDFRADNSRKTVPVQPVDATPSNRLIGQHFFSELVFQIIPQAPKRVVDGLVS